MTSPALRNLLLALRPTPQNLRVSARVRFQTPGSARTARERQARRLTTICTAHPNVTPDAAST